MPSVEQREDAQLLDAFDRVTQREGGRPEETVDDVHGLSRPTGNARQRALRVLREKRPELVLYRCERLSAWLTVNACTTLRRSAGPRGPVHRYDRHDLEPREVRPCAGCPGVVELRARGETPAPRQIATGFPAAVLT